MFRDMSLAKKLISGFSFILILLTIVSALSFYTIESASEGFTTYRGLARDTNLMGRVQANMLMVRMNVKDFIITGSDKDKKQYEEYAIKTRVFVEEAQREIKNTERARLVDQADTALQEYEKGFKKVDQAHDARNRLIHDVLAPKGDLLLNRLTDILVSAEKDGDMLAAYQTSLALKQFLLVRMYAMYYIESNSDKYVTIVKAEFDKILPAIDILKKELQNQQRRKWLLEFDREKDSYLEGFLNLVDVIRNRNQIISGTLDRLGPEIAKAVEDTKLSVKNDQDILGPMVQAENDQGVMFIIILAVIAIVIGLALAWFIVRGVLAQLGQDPKEIADIAKKLGQGDLDIQFDETNIRGVYGEIKNTVDNLKTAIKSIQETMNKVSQGDFTDRVGDAGMSGELVLIKDAINTSIDMLSNTITQVVIATDQVNSGANQISSASQSLASGTTQQAASLEEISSSMSEVGSRANASNDNASQAAQLTTQTMEVANRGNAQMKEMLSSMDKINNSSADISKIIKVIDEIAFQTNLLALNAAVEAARAGKYGKGFAVVAEEVRNLAARSAEAAKNTTDLIENSVKEVDSGVSNAGKTAEVLTEINESITKVNDLVGEIAAASQEQSTATDEINKSLTQVNEVVQANSSISEEAASASEELSGQAMELQGQMARFKLNQARTAQQPTPIQQKDPVEIPAEILASKAVNSTRMITLDDDNFGKY
ncbi:MAG: methyl-accepting chemotaxis protein [Deltaproteobacteria bacterium]|jgi:methyl-accepting chemotaxis protein|nr:methyl-accepting chemotaxis protein [Deltaproteobacteria bacterium]MBT4638266.1 methyl-accepting chemotaxis protein [Deltaproteobacteria bacterium]